MVDKWSKLYMMEPIAPKDIRCGDIGEKVQEIRRRLYDLGYIDKIYNGAFGTTTRDAVERFQEDNGLLPDGIVGEKTWNALMKA